LAARNGVRLLNVLLSSRYRDRFSCERPARTGSGVNVDPVHQAAMSSERRSVVPNGYLGFQPPRDFEAISLRPAGELDIATAADAFGLGRIVGSARRVILDFSGVTFIGAAALGAVVRLRNFALGSGGDIELIALPPKIERSSSSAD